MMSGENGDDLGEVFTVERILRKRRRRGRTEFLVKWKGYSSKHNTWEPDGNILDRGLIYAFESARRKKRGRPKRDLEQDNDSVLGQDDEEGRRKPYRRHVIIEESSSGSEDEGEKPEPRWQSSVITNDKEVDKKRMDSSQGRVLELENSDEEEMEIGRRSNASSKKKRLDSYTPPPSDHFDEEMNGDDEREEENEDQMPKHIERHPIRLTIRHSSWTIKEGSSTPTATVFPSAQISDRPRSSTKKMQVMDEEESASDNSTSSTSLSDSEAGRANHSKKRRRGRRKRSKVADTKGPSEAEPPELQVMVSDSELWFINERNTKHKQETAGETSGEGGKDGDVITSIQHDSVTNHLFGEASCDKEAEAHLNVVITDVKAHNYSVIIKECYQPTGFFKNSS